MVEIKNRFNRNFYLQWHLTNNCDIRCSHCYISNTKKKEYEKNELSLEECISVIESFREMSETLQFSGFIYFTGGNPLLKKDFFKIGEYAKSKGLKIGVLGNASSLLDKKLFERVKLLGIQSYQISIDGLEKNHEKIRGKGTFKTALLGLDKLVNEKIHSVVMSTITKENMWDIPKLIKISAERGINIFSFARIVPIGEGKKLKDILPSPEEYKGFLEAVYNTYRGLKDKYSNFRIGRKEPLWSLFFYEKGLLDITQSKGSIITGCSVGINNLCLDVDGIVYSCRRLEIPVGNVKEQSLEEIFLKSTTINEHREVENIKECNSCEVMPYCRGCRAVSYATSGNYFGKDPQCWKK